MKQLSILILFLFCFNLTAERIIIPSDEVLKLPLPLPYERKKYKIDEIISKVKNTGMEIYDISTEEGDLEDVFIDLTKN